MRLNHSCRTRRVCVVPDFHIQDFPWSVDCKMCGNNHPTDSHDNLPFRVLVLQFHWARDSYNSKPFKLQWFYINCLIPWLHLRIVTPNLLFSLCLSTWTVWAFHFSFGLIIYCSKAWRECFLYFMEITVKHNNYHKSYSLRKACMIIVVFDGYFHKIYWISTTVWIISKENLLTAPR